MRTADTLHSILDDAAAMGDADRIHALRARWQRRAARLALPDDVALVWMHASDAAYWRAAAVYFRMQGMCEFAYRMERESYRCIGLAENYGTR